MSVKSKDQNKNMNKNIKTVSGTLEETMFIGSVFCQDVPKTSKRTSLKNGSSFGINQYWLSKE